MYIVLLVFIVIFYMLYKTIASEDYIPGCGCNDIETFCDVPMQPIILTKVQNLENKK